MYPTPQQPPQRPSRTMSDRIRALPVWQRVLGASALGLIAVCLVCACASAGIAALRGGSGAPGGGGGQTTTTNGGPTAPPAATATPRATAKPKAWTTVNHFGGSSNGTHTYDVFHIDNGDHLVWKTTPSSSANLFAASLYRKGESFGNDLPYQDIANSANDPAQGDTITIQGDSADVYLWCQSDSVTWTVDIQRLQ